MPGFLSVADARILLGLNHALASNPTLYGIGLFLTGKFAIALMLLTLVYLWFWPQTDSGSVISPVHLPSAAELESPDRRRRLSPELKAAMRPFVRKLTRRQSRAQLLLVAATLVLTSLLIWLFAGLFDIDRPFVSFLPIQSYFDAFGGLRSNESFPGDYAALQGAFVVAMFYWNNRLGWTWLVLGVFFNIVSIAVGLYYPSDVLVGALVGAGLSYKLFSIYRREGWLNNAMHTSAVGFESTNSPYHYFLYFLLIVLGFELFFYFAHVIGVLEYNKIELMRKFQ